MFLVSWIDVNAVKMMTTIKGVQDWRKEFIIPDRRRPKSKSTNAAANHLLFGDRHRRLLPVPKIVDGYNQNMNGVDSLDQRRAAFDAQLPCRRNCTPIERTLNNNHRVTRGGGFSSPFHTNRSALETYHTALIHSLQCTCSFHIHR